VQLVMYFGKVSSHAPQTEKFIKRDGKRR